MNLRLWVAVLVAVALLSGSARVVFGQSATEQREAAVLKARAGQMAEAQAALRAMLAAGVDDGLVAMDLTTLLQQDGKPEEAVAVFERAASPDPPDYALLAATRAYRDLHRYDDAIRLAREGARRFPTDTVWPLLLSLALSDAGRTAEALEVLRQPAAQRASPVERLLAQGYAYRRAGDTAAAMRAYAEAVRLAPGNGGVRSEAADVLLDAGAPYGAAQIAGRTTPPIAAAEAGAMVRWGAEVRPPDPAQRFAGTDAALARLDSLIDSLPPEETALRRRLRLDRLVALRDRVRMVEALAEGEALSAEASLPPYAEEAYADALLYMRRPEQARDAYERVLAQTPRSLPARYGRFYAAVELEDFDTAYATIDAIVADEPVWKYYVDDPTPYDNPDRAYAEVTAAQARFYGNQLGEAWARITRISSAAPANGHARLAAYQIASARGWPRAAEAEAQIAASLEPRDVGSRIALVEVAIANYRFDEARRMLAELRALYPENQAVRQLARDFDAKTRWLVELEAQPGNSDGGGANASGQTLFLRGRITTPPIADNWRLFAFSEYSNAHPPEGFVNRTRAGAGVEWRSPGLLVTAYPTNSWGTLQRAGGGATVDWSVTDQILLAFSAEAFSADTPLRALLFGISADELAFRATYRWHESRSVSGTFSYMPFTDGNQRISVGATYKERLVDVPHFNLTGRADVFTSSNTRPDAPYYNPSRDLTVTGGLQAEHMIWRRYDNSLVQALAVDAGLYAEQGYADNWVGTINYEHRWRFDPLTELRYGVMLTRRVYDGSVEQGYLLTIGLRQRI
jgi:biofilm PGA synthesis protein PgaA